MTVAARCGLALLAASVGCPFAQGQNLLTNGGFEAPEVSGLGFFASIPGWTLVNGVSFEVQRSVAGSPAEGAQHIELDSEGSSTILQDVMTVPGMDYDIVFAFSARQGVVDNRLEFSWDGVVIDTLSRDGTGLSDTDWLYSTYTLRASSTLTPLRFADLSVSDSLGTYIDDVCVSEAAIPPGSACVTHCQATIVAPADFTSCWGEPVILTPLVTQLLSCSGVAEYRWSSGTDVRRDWDSESSFLHWTDDAEQLTLELRCSTDLGCSSSDQVAVSLHDSTLPESVGPLLRVSKQGAGMQLAWPGASLPTYEGHWHVRHGGGASGHFWISEVEAIPSNTWLDTDISRARVYYDVRAADGCRNESQD